MTKINLDFKRGVDSISDQRKGVVVPLKKHTTFRLFESFKTPLNHLLIDKEISFSFMLEKIIEKKTKDTHDVPKIVAFWEEKRPNAILYTKNVKLDVNKIKALAHFLEDNNLSVRMFFNYYVFQELKQVRK